MLSRPGDGVLRELYHVDGKIVGGALVGDITNAGRLHWMMTVGERVDIDFTALLEPRINTFARLSPSCVNHNLRAVLLPSRECET